MVKPSGECFPMIRVRKALGVYKKKMTMDNDQSRLLTQSINFDHKRYPRPEFVHGQII